MDTKRIADIGEVHWHDGNPYFLFGYSEEGFVFKDYDAYNNDWDAPCYVPECAAEDNAVTIDGVEYECGGDKDKCNWYSHNDLLALCYYNHKLCDDLFGEIDWCYPETWLDDRDNYGLDYNEYFDFVKVGNTVYWDDPDADLQASGYYEVLQIDDCEKPWELDTLVLIDNGYSTEEVPLSELMIDAPDKILKHKEAE